MGCRALVLLSLAMIRLRAAYPTIHIYGEFHASTLFAYYEDISILYCRLIIKARFTDTGRADVSDTLYRWRFHACRAVSIYASQVSFIGLPWFAWRVDEAAPWK